MANRPLFGESPAAFTNIFSNGIWCPYMIVVGEFFIRLFPQWKLIEQIGKQGDNQHQGSRRSHYKFRHQGALLQWNLWTCNMASFIVAFPRVCRVHLAACLDTICSCVCRYFSRIMLPHLILPCHEKKSWSRGLNCVWDFLMIFYEKNNPLRFHLVQAFSTASLH